MSLGGVSPGDVPGGGAAAGDGAESRAVMEGGTGAIGPFEAPGGHSSASGDAAANRDGAAQGLDWPGLMRVGMGPSAAGGLGLRPAQFWALSPAELALMLGISSVRGAMTRDRLAQLSARFPDHTLAPQTDVPEQPTGREPRVSD